MNEKRDRNRRDRGKCTPKSETRKGARDNERRNDKPMGINNEIQN
jgi:hypothetical protein